MNNAMSARAQVVLRRTYSREKPDGTFETWSEIVDRVINHQKWLWERALNRPLKGNEWRELQSLHGVIYDRRGLLAGRTLWLGGTNTGKTREASQFNCSGLLIETVYDFVDAFWLLLQGCGVGGQMVPGCLHGFPTFIPVVRVVPSTKAPSDRGDPDNGETWADGVWTIKVGDSAQAWAKAFGKLLAGKYVNCKELVLDFSEIRGAGGRLKGYGWLCHGYKPLAAALTQIAGFLNLATHRILSASEMHDIFNLLGTVLSTRRSAQIALFDYGEPGWDEFVNFKQNLAQTPWRMQSNNTLNFYERPSLAEIYGFLGMMVAAGGSEPGIRNAAAAQRRAPWCRVTNPCAEILLPNKGFCNLVTCNLAHPAHQDPDILLDTLTLLARANYRQTCVNLEDGILQRAWHENNEALRLCGVSLTGIMSAGSTPLVAMHQVARHAAEDMADELELPRPMATTTIKPEGTASKVLDTSEGMHVPFAPYVLNNINFSEMDPLLPKLKAAGYPVWQNPADPSGMLVSFPMDHSSTPTRFFTESAVAQLNRYKSLLTLWADHNVSCTIYYDLKEIPEIAKWLFENWDDYVSVSFLRRQDPTMTAADLGYSYLPQEAISREKYGEIMSQIKPVDIGVLGTHDPVSDGCAGGACPVV